MNILLTNDDGIDAEGLKTAFDVLSRKHNVYVIAPDRNRSCVSHGIYMNVPLRLNCCGENRYSSAGLPADCTIIGLRAGLFPHIDVVVSGINSDSNLGTDILYSGTCAAARQGAIYGVPSIAVSLTPNADDNSGEKQYTRLAEFVLDNLEKLMALCGSTVGPENDRHKECFVNVNALSCDHYNGVTITSMSDRSYGDSVAVRKLEDGTLATQFLGGTLKSFGGEDADAFAVARGFVSVSAVDISYRFRTDEYRHLENDFIVG